MNSTSVGSGSVDSCSHLIAEVRSKREIGEVRQALKLVRRSMKSLFFPRALLTRDPALRETPHTLIRELPAPKARARCITFAKLLYEEGLCQLSLGNRLAAIACLIITLDFMMCAIERDESITEVLAPSAAQLSDQIARLYASAPEPPPGATLGGDRPLQDPSEPIQVATKQAV